MNKPEYITKLTTETEEEFWCRSVRLASQDQQRNKEITAWDKVASKINHDRNYKN